MLNLRTCFENHVKGVKKGIKVYMGLNRPTLHTLHDPTQTKNEKRDLKVTGRAPKWQREKYNKWGKTLYKILRSAKGGAYEK